MKKFVYLCLSSFMIMQANALKECQNDQDKISGCIEKTHYKGLRIFEKIPYQDETNYYGDGNLRIESPYQNDKQQGIAKGYYENGNLWQETPYQNGKKQGIAKLYYENGNLGLEIVYKDGVAISGKCANGKKLTNAHLHNLSKGGEVRCN